MSVLQQKRVKCICSQTNDITLAKSVNATRSPKYREKILAGDFHRFKCSSCQNKFLVEKEFNYVDIKNKTFIKVLPPDKKHRWKEASINLDKELVQLPDWLVKSKRTTKRVVFGLGELREKLIAEDEKIDDRSIEIIKLFAIHEHPILIKEPRLRLQLDQITVDDYCFVASYDHHPRKYSVKIPKWSINNIINDKRALKRWMNRHHKSASLFKLENDYWINIWRWSGQPSAIATLNKFAELIENNQDIDVESEEFKLMMEMLPSGTHMLAMAKQKLKILLNYARRKKLNEIQRLLFEIRFNLKLEDDWAKNNQFDSIATLWELLRNLPSDHVEGNAFFREINLEEGDEGGGYSPSRHDIYIGDLELANIKTFEDLVRHEVGHSVHQKHLTLVDNWLKDEFGWESFGITDSEIGKWVDLMGGWGDIKPSVISEICTYLRAAIGSENNEQPGTLPTNIPESHAWKKDGFGPRIACEKTGLIWYDESQEWYRVESIGKAFFLNYKYNTFSAVNISTLEFINNSMPKNENGNIAAMSHFEFFAELYALYYDLREGSMRGNISEKQISWLDKNINHSEQNSLEFITSNNDLSEVNDLALNQKWNWLEKH